MYKRALVALDGSPAAEAILPLVFATPEGMMQQHREQMRRQCPMGASNTPSR